MQQIHTLAYPVSKTVHIGYIQLSDKLMFTALSTVVTDGPVAAVDPLSTFFTADVVEPVDRTAHMGLLPTLHAVPVPGQDNVTPGSG